MRLMIASKFWSRSTYLKTVPPLDRHVIGDSVLYHTPDGPGMGPLEMRLMTAEISLVPSPFFTSSDHTFDRRNLSAPELTDTRLPGFGPGLGRFSGQSSPRTHAQRLGYSELSVETGRTVNRASRFDAYRLPSASASRALGQRWIEPAERSESVPRLGLG